MRIAVLLNKTAMICVAACAMTCASEASAQTQITINGKTYEVKAGRPIVIGPDGTPAYGDVDAPRMITDVAKSTAATTKTAPQTEAPATAPVAPMKAKEVAAVAVADAAFLAPGTEEGIQTVMAKTAPAATVPTETAAVAKVAIEPAQPIATATVPIAITKISAQTATIVPSVPTAHNWPVGLVIPKSLPDGGYATPNRSVSASAAIWHMRVALNVAALSCRGPNEARIVGSYNTMLVGHRRELAAAELAVAREYAANTAQGRARYDDSMTRLYNFFATPAAQRGFCAAAVATFDALEAADAKGASFDAFCPDALKRIETPFTDFYREYAAWSATRPGTSVKAGAPTEIKPAIMTIPDASVPTIGTGAMAIASTAAEPKKAFAAAPAADDPAQGTRLKVALVSSPNG